jgi:hypothetical protein
MSSVDHLHSQTDVLIKEYSMLNLSAAFIYFLFTAIKICSALSDLRGHVVVFRGGRSIS